MNVKIIDMAPDMEALKARLKATWMSGDYGTFAKYMEPGALKLLKDWQIPTGARLLDVACGAGQIAIPAARAGAHVTGIDIASNWIEQARARATTAGVTVQFDEGDAEDLPYPDASFDVVVTLVGAMFAPRPERVAAELVRVTRPGGRIIMVNWTPPGFVGQMFKAIAKHVPPPPGVPPASLWGDEATVRDRLRDGIKDLKLTRRTYPLFDYPFAVPEVVEFFRQNYGPIQRAFAALDGEGQKALRHDLEQVFSSFNRSTNGRTSLEAEFLEVIAVRQGL
ncbi:MAG TPA: class I SAM-dependent methyltransferase [Anaerolineales bacterium]|nr:class I SAM-dependent methyltransferase [Anaerolineales bacterium]